MRITDSISWDATLWTVKYRLELACPSLRNRIQVINTNDPYSNKEDGLNWLIWFENVKFQVGQF
jgi:hypothetical protein